MTRNELARLLMRRDMVSRKDAERSIDGCLEALANCHGDYEMAVDIIYLYLGLEPDVLCDLVEMM